MMVLLMKRMVLVIKTKWRMMMKLRLGLRGWGEGGRREGKTVVLVQEYAVGKISWWLRRK